MDFPVSIKVEGNLTTLLEEIYGDVAKPSFVAIGKTLGTAFEFFNTLLLPVNFMNECARILVGNNIEKYRQRIEQIPYEELCEVNPTLAIPVLEKFTYVTDEELRDLYINLLYSASWTKTQHLAHPSSLKIIESLSPDEAKILNFVSETSEIPFIKLRVESVNKGFFDVREHNYLTGIESKVSLCFPENLSLYIDNLIALGLYNYDPSERLQLLDPYTALKSEYEPMIKNKEIETLEDYPEYKLTVKYQLLVRSALGDRFIETCILRAGDDK